MNDQQQIEYLAKAIVAIDSQCDGAVSRDNVGFNKLDGGFLKSLRYNWESNQKLSPKQYNAGLKSLRKYKRQAQGLGFDLERLQYMKIEKPKTKKISFEDLKSYLTKDLDNSFWDFWRIEKENIKKLGYKVIKEEQGFKLTWNDPESEFQKQVNKVYSSNEERRQAEFKEYVKKLKYPKLLLKYQRNFVLMRINSILSFGGTLDRNRTGAGKTYCSLAVAKELGLYPVILTTKSNVSKTKKVMKEHFKINGIVTNYESVKFPVDMTDQILMLTKIIFNISKSTKLSKNLLAFNSYFKEVLHTWKEEMRIEPVQYNTVLKILKKNHHAVKKLGFKTKDLNYMKEEYGIISKEEFKRKNKVGREVKDYKFTWHVDEKTLIVADEVHKCKNFGTQNERLLSALHNSKAKIYMMSATVADNPERMGGVGKLLGLFNTDKEFFKWAFANGCVAGAYGGFKFTNSPGAMEKLREQIEPHRGGAIPFEEMKDLFQETQIQADCYDLDEPQRKKLDRIYKELTQNISDKNLQLEIVDRQKQSQAAELIKIPIFIEQAQNALEEGLSVAIFVKYDSTVKEMAKALKTDQVVVGGQKQALRDQILENFQSDKERVIILNEKAGGQSIDLHDLNGNHPRLSLINPTDSAITLIQVLGRIDRSGAKTPTIQKLIFVQGTIEEQICENVQKKINNINSLNDSDLTLF